MIGKFVLVYLDDILIFSKTPEEHEQHLEMVLQRLAQHRFYAQLPKCHFALPEVEFLGHLVSAQGIKVDPRKVKIVADWPTPSNVNAVAMMSRIFQPRASHAKYTSSTLQ